MIQKYNTYLVLIKKLTVVDDDFYSVLSSGLFHFGNLQVTT